MKTIFTLLIFFLTLFIFQSCVKEPVTSSLATAGTSDEQISELGLADSGLLCYFPFNGNLKDKSKNGNNGTQFGTLSFVPDRFGNAGKAVSFAASNAWVEIPDEKFNGMTKGTISIDFYENSSNQQLLMSKMSMNAIPGTPEYYQSFVLTTVPGSSAPIQWRCKKTGHCSDEDWNNALAGPSAFALNTWNHIAVTFNDSIQKIYLNGRLISALAKEPSVICGTEPIRLGVWWSVDPNFFTGYMDEVRIYDRVLSAKEIKKLSTL